MSLYVPRRAVLGGGIAALAAIFGRSIAACSSDDGNNNATPAEDAGPEEDASTSVDAGDGEEFPYEPVTRPKIVSRIAAIGPLGAANADGIRLPPGFTGRIVAKSGTPTIPGKPHEWHSAPDGGACFPLADGGFVYVSNSEVPLVGGVSALRFDSAGNAVDAYRILDKTSVNCAGGPTPWDTWLSCEEVEKGRVHECDPKGKLPAIARPALGVFKHEAAAVDPIQHRVYLTEDEPNGCFYRFVPDKLRKDGFANLSSGKLEVAVVGADGKVTWAEVPDPQYTGETPTRLQVANATKFSGGEGIWWHAGIVYFTTKGTNEVWAYDTNTQTLTVLYDPTKSDGGAILSGVDNVTVSASGDVLVAEDGGDMQVVAILPSGEQKALVQLEGYESSEITGPAFDPSGTRLYFSSQRGPKGGTTFEVTGPFHELA